MIGDHPMVAQSMRRVQDQYWPWILLGLGVAFILGHVVAFSYISFWAMEAWEWIGLGWWRDFLSIFEGWYYEIVSIQFLKIPLDKMYNILMSAQKYASQ